MEDNYENEEEKINPEAINSMKLAIFGVEPIFVPIPPLFCDSVTKEPYSKCLICEESLENKEYRVNKVLKKYPEFELTETLIEMAICNKCALDSAFKISKESEQTIMEFFGKIDFIDRMINISQSEEADQYEKWIEKCIITDNKRNEITEYQVIACVSAEGKLALDAELFMVSGQAIEALNEKLSAETRQDLEDFTGKHFGIPPELMPEDKPKLILV